MDFRFDLSLISGYTSKSQIVRILTESWVGDNLYCPRCGCPKINHFPNNSAVADFYCPNCRNEFELKSKKGKIGKKIADGEYQTFINRITSNNNPDFFILNYNETELCVENLWVIPKHFFVPAIVEKRNPLSPNARRAGWTGCNIIFSEIPEQGRIGIINNRSFIDKNVVINHMRTASQLHTNSLDARGWLMDVLNCINAIPASTFTLKEMYHFSALLQSKHPDNNHIQPKIRQQLQVLRDKGFIEFLGHGMYRKL